MGAATPSKRARTTAAPIAGTPQKLKNVAAGTLFTDQIATPREVPVASDLSWTPEKIEQRPRPRRASAKVRLPADLVRGFVKDWDAMEDLLSYVLRSNPSAKSRYSHECPPWFSIDSVSGSDRFDYCFVRIGSIDASIAVIRFCC
jgi:hypothetical protein